jgi:uncharacterized Fe-S cluster protein YjdI/CDGSH-type Zn-finger protein
MTDADISAVPTHWGRAYTAPEITVYYDVSRCIHVAACVRGLPQVFDTNARPWIQAGNAPAETLAEVVRRCLTGALHYVLGAGPAEAPDPATSVEVIQNGPLFVRGDLMIVSASAPVRETRAALCRCGASAHAPYCDNSHRRTGFQAEGVTRNDSD